MRIISNLKIDVLSVKKNIERSKRLSKARKYCFVAKANCYGLGIELCKYVEDDVDCFAVSSADEFLELRKLVSKPIMILDPVFEDLEKLAALGAILTVSNQDSAQKIIEAAAGQDILFRVQLALNSGMNRFGFKDASELAEVCKKLKKAQNISVFGAFSHYFNGKSKKDVNFQNKNFTILCSEVKRFFSQNMLFHISATGSVDGQFLDMVRIGIGNFTDEFYDTISLTTRVLDIQVLAAGESAGYSAVFVAKKKTTIAVIGIGYGDGIMRNIVKKGYVLINDKWCKILAICMDVMLVDVSAASAKVGTEVTVIGKSKSNKIFICDVADWCDTISYEIIVRLSSRIKRSYIEGYHADNNG